MKSNLCNISDIKLDTMDTNIRKYNCVSLREATIALDVIENDNTKKLWHLFWAVNEYCRRIKESRDQCTDALLKINDILCKSKFYRICFSTLSICKNDLKEIKEIHKKALVELDIWKKLRLNFCGYGIA